ncbi:MAG: hypothetical protein NT038_01970 [Euryarchaeota archaeon]|nr:hypothetical protein [Euryarchaeota archaeon]
MLPRNSSRIVILFCFTILCAVQLVNAENPVRMEYFYSDGCPNCAQTTPIIEAIEEEYENNISIERFEIGTLENWNQWNNYGFLEVPAIVINNQTKIPKEQITKEKLTHIIDWYLANMQPNLSFVDESQKTAVAGEQYTFIVKISDPENITNISVTWVHGALNGIDIPLQNNLDGSWDLTITLDTNVDDLRYTITAMNPFDITQSGSEQLVTINRNPLIIITPWGDINTAELSLPLLTIILGGLDSINPCSFFILLFLLNLLLYAKSRKRMFLIGSIFIFFSGFIYFLFMTALLSIFLLTAQITFITIIAGIIALFLGGLNIKDFFFFKKGPSLSIPEDKKPKLFQRMRELVKASYLPTMIIGTIALAIFANTYELFCTLGFPLLYTKILTMNNLSFPQYIIYIFFYNVVYVLPLIIIVAVFVITLGRRKLSEWQGRLLKLISGMMMFSLGLVLVFIPEFMNNVFSAALLLFVALGGGALIGFITKRYQEKTKQEIP